VVQSGFPGSEPIALVQVRFGLLFMFTEVRRRHLVTLLRRRGGVATRGEGAAVRNDTGQFAFAELVRIYGGNFDHAGVGATIALPT
jgi:hypothetical protein